MKTAIISTLVLIIVGTCMVWASEPNFYSSTSIDLKLCNIEFVTGGESYLTKKQVDTNITSGLIQVPKKSKDAKNVPSKDFVEIVCVPIPIDNQKYQLIVDIFCDSDETSTKENRFSGNQEKDSDGTLIAHVFGSSRYGCVGAQLPELLSWYTSHEETVNFVFQLALISLGVFCLFLGLKIFNFAIFSIATILGTIIVYLIAKNADFLQIQQNIGENGLRLSIYGLSLICGILIGYVTFRLRKIGFFITGAIAGILVGNEILVRVVFYLKMQNSNEILSYAILAAGFLAGGWIIMKTFEGIVILISSIIGALILQYIFFGEFSLIVSISLFCILIIVGIYSQFKQMYKVQKPLKSDPKKKKEKSKLKKE